MRRSVVELVRVGGWNEMQCGRTSESGGWNEMQC